MNTSELKQRFLISEEDLDLLSRYTPALMQHLPSCLMGVQMALRYQKQQDGLPVNEEEETKLMQDMVLHWGLLLRLDFSAEYFKHREGMGTVLSQSGISPIDFFALTNLAVMGLQGFLKETGNCSLDVIMALGRVLAADTAIIIGSYDKVIQKSLREQNLSMSTPVAEIYGGVLFLPLVGIIDSRRAQEVMSTMLKKISESQAKVFILDISGVAIMDTSVANHLIKVTKATRLMGCKCIISGISPAVAQTLVELGVQTEEVSTTGSMKDALGDALRVVGVHIAQKATA